MKLNFEQIASAAQGAVRVKEGAEGIEFNRFTEEQEELYRREHNQLLNKVFATSGIALAFSTDSKSLTLNVRPSAACTRSFYSFDVAVNGCVVGHMDNVPDGDRCLPSFQGQYSLDDNKKTFSFEEGQKTVEIFFPWTIKPCLRELSLDDGASFAPLPPRKKLLAFGDSITQGFDAFRPANSYIVRTARALGMSLYNKSIGAERFFPELALCRDSFTPDLITVAYGTNDWNHVPTRSEYETNCKLFFQNIRKTYPDTRIVAISPIWRKDRDTEGKCFPFDELKTVFAEAVAPLSNVTLIHAYDFVPHDPKLFSDGFLHPNDAGFRFYADNLIAELKKTL